MLVLLLLRGGKRADAAVRLVLAVERGQLREPVLGIMGAGGGGREGRRGRRGSRVSSAISRKAYLKVFLQTNFNLHTHFYLHP